MSAADPSAITADTHKELPRTAIMVAITAATLGIIYGYDQSNIGGAQLYFQGDLGMETAAVESVTAAIVIGEIIGALIGGVVANKIGRKKSMILVAIGYAAFCVLSAAAVNVPMLWTARVFLGVTIGISLMTAATTPPTHCVRARSGFHGSCNWL